VPEKSLLKEAQKFKTAEEFVEAKINTFHGGEKIGDIKLDKSNYGKTFFLTDKADYAKLYAGKYKELGVVNDIALSPEAKLIDIKNIDKTVMDKIKKIAKGTETGKTFNIKKPDGTSVRVKETPKDSISFYPYSAKDVIDGAIRGKSHFAENPSLVEIYKKLGYDGMISYEEKGAKNIGIWNKNIVKTKSQLTDIFNQANKGKSIIPSKKVAPTVLRGTKNLTPKDIVATHADMNLKRDVIAKDIHGNKINLVKGEALSVKELTGNKFLIQDGEAYVINKGQFQNLRGQSVVDEAKEFAPELLQTKETVRGGRDLESEIDSLLGDEFGQGMTRAEVREFVQSNAESEVATKFENYTLPGGKDYREILIQAPENKSIINQELEVTQLANEWRVTDANNEFLAYGKTKTIALNNAKRELKELQDVNQQLYKDRYNIKPFKSSHWEEPNVISHLRINDRRYKGQKVSFMEELQSDWAKEGRDKGFREIYNELPENVDIKMSEPHSSPGRTFYHATSPEGLNVLYASKGKVGSKQNINDALEALSSQQPGTVPNNPLLKNWQEMSVKRALKEAVDTDAKYFSWINGEQTSARYNLATHVENVSWETRPKNLYPEGEKNIHLTPKGDDGGISLGINNSGKIVGSSEPSFEGKRLDEVLGKGLADKIMEKKAGELSGEGLSFGGEWASNLYDKQVKNIVKDLTGQEAKLIDLGLPIDKDPAKFIKQSGRDAGGTLSKGDLKVGLEINKKGSGDFVITDVLADGKFKAIQKRSLEPGVGITKYPDEIKETFDISTKTTTQQAIKITPEVRAIVRGEKPPLKKPSGKLFERLRKIPIAEGIPLLLLALGLGGTALNKN